MSFQITGQGIARIPAERQAILGKFDESLGQIEQELIENKKLMGVPSPDQEYLHGPMHPEFNIPDDLEEIDRAVEDGTLSPEDGRRIIEILEAAPGTAAAYDAILAEFYNGPTSPNHTAHPEQSQHLLSA